MEALILLEDFIVFVPDKVYSTLILLQISKQKPVYKPVEKEMPSKPKVSSKPVMSAEAAAYPKLFKIYKELKWQNEIIKNDEIGISKRNR